MTQTPEPLHISILLDRSGSMSSIADPMVEGLNEWMDAQRKLPGDARVALVQFDSEDPFAVHIDGVPLREVTALDRSSFQPRAMTPLYDAIGRLVSHLDAAIAKRDELDLPQEDQVVVIITDGVENASREHTRDTAFELIKGRRQRDWAFVFLGANQDSFGASESLHIGSANAANWDASAAGTKEMFRKVGMSTSRFQGMSKAERARQLGKMMEEETDSSGDERPSGDVQ